MAKNLLGLLKAKVQESPPVDIFDSLTAADKEANKLLVEIALMISNRRKDLGFSQSELATLLDISQPMISQYESGDCNFTIETLAQVCEALKMKVSLTFQDIDGNPLTQFKDTDGSSIDCREISEAA